MRHFVLGLLAALTAGTIAVPPAVAADRTVEVGGGHEHLFIPARVAIKPGESVTWSNNDPGGDDAHNVRFEDGKFTQPPTPSNTFSPVTRAFPAAGAYAYYCENHGGPGGSGMSGVVYVNARAELPPVAKLSVAPNPGVAGREVRFDGSSSSATDTTIVKYEWDLDGDGLFELDTGTTAFATKTYMTARDFDVKVRVTDARGATDVRTRPFIVESPSSPPDASPNAQPGPVVPPAQPAPILRPPAGPPPAELSPKPKPAASRRTPGTCSKLKGRKRATCIKRHCAKLKGAKKRACVKRVTRKR